jgi:CHAT domain-containing protein/tetratricopeptide (TPR) repeat protein
MRFIFIFSLTLSITVLPGLYAQTYEKDWQKMMQTLEGGQAIGAAEWEAFAARYKSKLGAYPDNTTQMYSLLGHEYSGQQQPEKAEENYLLSLNYARQATDTSLKHIVAYSLGVLNYNNHNLLQAEKYYLSCMVGMSAIYGQSSREYTAIFAEYTRLLTDLGKYAEAKPYVEALLYYYKTLDGENNKDYLIQINLKAIIAQNQGNYEEAIAIFLDVVENERTLKLGDTIGHLIGLNNLGDVYRETGNFEQALAYVNKAKRLFSSYKIKDKNGQPKDPELMATIESNLGLCYKGLGDPQKAEEAYNQALRVYRETGLENTEPYCSTLSNKANLISDLGRRGEASEILLAALEIRKKYFGDRTENYANALANLANVYFDEGFYQESLEKNLQANAIYKETVGEQHQGYANNLNSLSLCYLQLKDYQKAEEYKLKALQIIEAGVGKDHYRYASFLISTCSMYAETRQYKKAEDNLKEAMQLVERNLGRRHELFALAQFALADVYALQGKFEAAGPLYFESLDHYSAQLSDYFNAMSEENQRQFLNSISSIFESYNVYLVNYKLSQPSGNFSEHLKRALKYQMQLKSLLANRSAQVRKEVTNSGDKGLQELYRNWLAVKTELINRFKSTEPVADNNNDLLLKASDMETRLKAQVKAFSTSIKPTFESLKSQLRVNEAAVEVFKVSDTRDKKRTYIRYGALVIRNNSLAPELVIFKEGNTMDSAGFDRYSKYMEEQRPDSLSYAVYFKPLERPLKGVNRLYLSSDGIFHKIAFSGLYNPAGKKYLGESLSLIQTSNLGAVSSASMNAVAGISSAALFGYPDYDYDFKKESSQPAAQAEQAVAKRFGLTYLAKLPGTKTEVEEINKTLKEKNWNTQIYTEQFASEKNLRAVQGPNVLHIATHGFYLKDIASEDKLFLGFERSTIQAYSLLRSGIILAGATPATQDSTNLDSENDGILTADEASMLNLSSTNLVVLSACQTGLGDEMGTEGVAGLQRSFAIAGAKHIIMSLWPVDDDATQQLMTEFYKNYALARDVEGAFKQAQKTVREKYPHPYYWAAFVLLKTFN